MGLSISVDDVEFYDKSKTITYKKFVEKDGVATITKEDFISKFSTSMKDILEVLWKKYVFGNEMMLHEYERIIEDLNFESKKTRYFISLLTYDFVTFENVKTLFKWCSFDKLSDKYLDALLVGIRESQGKYLESFPKDPLLSFLDRHFPDMCDDLAFIITHSMKTDEFISPSFPLDLFKDGILNIDYYWTMIYCLPQTFRKRNDTVLKDSMPLLMEQLSHIKCLYSSPRDGLSLNKMRELCFDYGGPILMIIEAEENSFIVAMDQGIRESWHCFGINNSRLYQIYPKVFKLLSGSASKDEGIFYSQFTAKTAKLGFLIGHKPLSSPVIEIDEGFAKLSFSAGLFSRINGVEVWAAGASMHLSKFQEIQEFKKNQVQKEKNKKFKLDADDWKSNPDRILLDLGGIDVNNAELAGGRDVKKD